MPGEFEFIDRLRRRLPTPPPGQVWVGDDAAVLEDGLLLATDILVDGVHFRSEWCEPADVGWKALAVNISDVAAMGGSPVAAVAAMTVPPGAPGLADAVSDGLIEAADTLGCPLVGGDTTSGPTLTIAVAVLGRSGPNGVVLRGGARTGDLVFVTGVLGLAAGALDDLVAGRDPAPGAALHLHRPLPRQLEGRAAAAAGTTAMIDVSDGLAGDLAHICDASGVGVEIEAGALPVADGVDLARALVAGDDYELCFTAPDGARVSDTFAEHGLDQPSRIGQVTGEGRWILAADDSHSPFPLSGWEHDVC